VRRRTERALARLADGTLPPRRRAALRRKVARSAELSRALDAQCFAVTVVRGLRDPAPPRLRAWIENAMRDCS
jgi:hypothetical protein